VPLIATVYMNHIGTHVHNITHVYIIYINITHTDTYDAAFKKKKFVYVKSKTADVEEKNPNTKTAPL